MLARVAPDTYTHQTKLNHIRARQTNILPLGSIILFWRVVKNIILQNVAITGRATRKNKKRPGRPTNQLNSDSRTSWACIINVALGAWPALCLSRPFGLSLFSAHPGCSWGFFFFSLGAVKVEGSTNFCRFTQRKISEHGLTDLTYSHIE